MRVCVCVCVCVPVCARVYVFQGNYAVSGGVKGCEAVEAKAKSFKARMTVRGDSTGEGAMEEERNQSRD